MYIILSYTINDKLFQEFGGHVINSDDEAKIKKEILKYKKEKAKFHKCEVKDIYLHIKNLKKE